MAAISRAKYGDNSGKNLRRVRHVKSKDGSDYTVDQIEFIMAIDKYKLDKNRPYPTWVEILQIAKSLGYSKQ